MLALRFSLLAALTLTACSKPKPPTIIPIRAEVVRVGPAGVQLAVTFDVTNQNSFPLVARTVDGRFLLGAGGAELGRAHAEPFTSIPAGGTSTVSSDLAVNWTNLAALAPFLLSPAPVPYQFNGNATLGGDTLNVTLPFTLSGELTREQLLSAGLNGLAPPAH